MSLSAWHAYKYIDPKESGAVLPIVHANGFKISERTIYGCMDDKELDALFMGYGYQVRIVGHDLDGIDEDMAASLQWALGVIRSIQKAARQGKPIFKPRWPVIILRTSKVRISLGCRGALVNIRPVSRVGVDLRSTRVNSSRVHSTLTKSLFPMLGRIQRDLKRSKLGFHRIGPASFSPIVGNRLTRFSLSYRRTKEDVLVNSRRATLDGNHSSPPTGNRWQLRVGAKNPA